VRREIWQRSRPASVVSTRSRRLLILLLTRQQAFMYVSSLWEQVLLHPLDKQTDRS
jgi:hypothetical protein